MPGKGDGEHTVRNLAFLQTMFESSFDAILALDNDLIIDCNRTAEEMFGRPREAITGGLFFSLSPEHQPDGQDTKERARGLFAAAFMGEPQSAEWMFLRADKTPFPAELSLTRVQVDGKTYLQATIRDITLRRMDEDELRETYGRISAAEKELRQQYAALAETEEMFRNPVEHSPVGVYLQQDGIIRYANPRFAGIFGYARDEIIGRPFEEIVRPGVRPDAVTESGRPSQHREFAARTKDGGTLELEVFEAPMEYQGRPAFYGNLVDITRRKRDEATIRGLLNATRDETVLTDNDGRILAANEAFAASAKKPVHELVNMVIYDLIRTGGISMRTADEMQKKGAGSVSFEEQIGNGGSTRRSIPSTISGESGCRWPSSAMTSRVSRMRSATSFL